MKRLAEDIGLEVKTIHWLLEFDPRAYGICRGAELPLECDVLLLDEASISTFRRSTRRSRRSS